LPDYAYLIENLIKLKEGQLKFISGGKAFYPETQFSVTA
jgi:hypothetical protein